MIEYKFFGDLIEFWGKLVEEAMWCTTSNVEVCADVKALSPADSGIYKKRFDQNQFIYHYYNI